METPVARRGPLHALRGWLVLLSVAGSACVTDDYASTRPPPDYPALCEAGDSRACEVWARRLFSEGRREEAAAAYGRACRRDDTPACLTEGQLRMELGQREEAAAAYEQACLRGGMSACLTEGRLLTDLGHREEAAVAYGRACQQGDTSACLTEGRLRMELGDLEGAEPPLRKTYDAGMPDGTEALADVRAARGDEAGAERLRYEALSIDKSVVELVIAYRFGLGGGNGLALDLNVQPMAFLARRLNVGVNMVVMDRGSATVGLNGYAGYQYFVSDWAAPYARVLSGSLLDSRRARFDVGAEAGLKLFAGPLGHAAFAFGTSLEGPTYMSLEVGMDWIVALYILAHAH
ncbi:hypothetical protein JY651_27040 [Pyxidicoccus parkwayensis]|uniref:Beta-lactamase n=1 Tax=Pyxidicoccus parkwayensis TaxID=2813578 RepID=A0ABX7NJK0_9BACT|nr:hypothetical protein [Pyxidicoccus parkwaysis]QSQ19004.1 hypothetical protein JY651_27040 [Pyxidicoccus parkwaysis]